MEFVLKKRHNAVIPLIWLLIYFSIIPMALSNYVLCIGEDGHVEFELGINGRCVNGHDFQDDRAEVVSDTAGFEKKHCGSCVDFAIFVPLNSETYLVPVQNALILSPAFATALTTHPVSSSTILMPPSFLEPPSVVAPTLISLRSTMLLI